jgi:hypothetical protein
MSSESDIQSDFESVILYSANKIVSYIVGSRIPTINVIILTCFLIPCSMKSTPTAALEVLLMLPALDIFIERESRLTAYKLKCIGRTNQVR